MLKEFPVLSFANELQKPVLSQDLQLLADFRPDVPVRRIKRLQVALEPVDICELKNLRVDPFDAGKDVDNPTAGVGAASLMNAVRFQWSSISSLFTTTPFEITWMRPMLGTRCK